MDKRLQRAGLAVLAAALTLTVSGCGGNDDAAPAPTPKFSSSTAAPTSPTVSTTANPQSPEAFLRSWNKAQTEMQNSGDSTEFKMMSQGCAACATTADRVQKYYQAGGYVRTTAWRLTNVNCKDKSGSEAQCTAHVSYGKTVYRESSGSQEMTLASGSFKGLFTLDRKPDSSWTMTNVEQLPT